MTRATQHSSDRVARPPARHAGYSLDGHGPTRYEGRTRRRRLGARLEPALSLADPTWRRYYSPQNLVWILREIEQPRSGVRVTVLTGSRSRSRTSRGNPERRCGTSDAISRHDAACG